MSSSSAGPSQTQLHQPPPPLQEDDAAIAKVAHAHISPRVRFLSFLPSFHPAREQRKDKKAKRMVREESRVPDFLPVVESAVQDAGLVELSDQVLNQLPDDQGGNAPQYRWAILYENQRGATVFATPYYSPESLLPLDPPAYSLPTPKPSRRVWRAQPTVSLASYPLPDGTWRWVSRTWMIDMRGDGQVQYDGFEYAWSFRSREWRPEVGFLSAGGWVRRRRWVRLMVRGVDQRASRAGRGEDLLRPDAERAVREEGGEGYPEVAQGMQHEEHLGVGLGIQVPPNWATRPPSVVPSSLEEEEEPGQVWQCDDRDWERCHAALKRLGRDGRKLELWKRWFGFGYESESPQVGDIRDQKGKGKVTARLHEVSSPSASDLSQDDELAANYNADLESEPKESIKAVVRLHGSEILQSFVFPDSRAQFLEILDAVGLMDELKQGMGVSDSSEMVDFWSYMHQLGSLHEEHLSPSPTVAAKSPGSREG